MSNGLQCYWAIRPLKVEFNLVNTLGDTLKTSGWVRLIEYSIAITWHYFQRHMEGNPLGEW